PTGGPWGWGRGGPLWRRPFSRGRRGRSPDAMIESPITASVPPMMAAPLAAATASRHARKPTPPWPLPIRTRLERTVTSTTSIRGIPMPRHTRHISSTLVALACLLAALVWNAAPGAALAEAQRKILNIAAKEPDTLDPHSSTLGQSQAIARFMFRGLTRFAIKDGKVTTAETEPDLAESWTLSPDGTVWTFK